jgi:hypothetical protein
MDLKPLAKGLPLIALPAGLGLFAWWVWNNFGPGAVVTDENGIAVDFNSPATRETRAKNLLGVSSSKWTVGAVGEDNELNDHLAIAPDTATGLKWAANLLKAGYFQAGYNTPLSIGTYWSQGKQIDDPTADLGYGNSVAEIMGVDPNSLLDFGIDGPNLMAAIARMENGTPAVISVPKIMYQNAIAEAEG